MTTHTGHTDAIAASRVIGTSVYNSAGQSIGTIEDVMLDKTSNGIMFAVIGFGGFPWHRRKIPRHPVVGPRLREEPWRLCRALHQGTARSQAPSHSIEELTAMTARTPATLPSNTTRSSPTGARRARLGDLDGEFCVVVHAAHRCGDHLKPSAPGHPGPSSYSPT